MKQISNDELASLFRANPTARYKKSGKYLAREATRDEIILTVVDGQLETINISDGTEIVLRNIVLGSSSETYMIKSLTFTARYKVQDPNRRFLMDGHSWFMAEAIGEIYAFKYVGEDIVFNAPWGESMICRTGDYIASPISVASSDIYRIEAKTFDQTYSQV